MGELGLDPVDEVHQHPAVVGVGDVVPDPLVGGRRDPLDLLGEQIQGPVEVVTAPVVDRAAADGLVGMPVVAGVAVAADEALVVEDLTELAAAHDLLEGEIVAVPPAVLIDGEHEPALLGRGDLLVGFGDGDAERLLHHHVLAGLESPQGPFGVRVGRGGDDDQVDVGVGQQVLAVGVAHQTGGELPGGRDPQRIGIADRRQREPIGQLDRRVVLVADSAVAQDADAHRGAVDLAGDPPQQAMHEALPSRVGHRRFGRADGQHPDAGARPPGRDRVVGEGDVGGQQHLDVVGDLLLQRPAVGHDQVAAQAGTDVAGVEARAHPDLVQRRDPSRDESSRIGQGGAHGRADEQHRRASGGAGEQGVLDPFGEVGGADDQDGGCVVAERIGHLDAAAGEVGAEGGGGADQADAVHAEQVRRP